MTRNSSTDEETFGSGGASFEHKQREMPYLLLS